MSQHSETIQYIESTMDFGRVPSLGRMRELSRRLGDPWRSLKCLHIAGTNGKGSISSYATHMLCHEGCRVGWYTSPYLERFSERIRVLDGAADLAAYDDDLTTGEIDEADIDRIMAHVREAVESMKRDGIVDLPTEFDLITAMAFLYFKEQRCDVVVLETGLGGRIDSTNVIESPLACILAAPGFDHTDRLGSTMDRIMTEKAGIVKPHVPVFAYDPIDALISPHDAAVARHVLEARCLELSAPLTFIGQDDFERLDYSREGQVFLHRATGERYTTRLLGLFQPINALLAAAALRDLVSPDAIRRGIADTVWPARLEIMSRDPFMLLDGAHNPQGCRALARALEQLAESRPLVFLSGMLRDKAYDEMLKLIFRPASYDIGGIVLTEPPGERRLGADELAEETRKALRASGLEPAPPILAVPEPAAALDAALAMAARCGGMICAFGSLYLAGEIRRAVRARRQTPAPR